MPGAIQACAYGLTNVIIQASVNSFGTDTAAGWAAYGKLDLIFWPTVFTLGGLFFIRMPWIMVITVQYHSLQTLLASYPLAWGGTLLCMTPYYFYRKKITLREDTYK